jgi:hypothetical protein
MKACSMCCLAWRAIRRRSAHHPMVALVDQYLDHHRARSLRLRSPIIW